MTRQQLQNWARQPQRRPLIMGILNVTPDSFSDGGHHGDSAVAVEHALKMIQEGADIIDIGGESTRPGARRISAGEQISRILPVIGAITSQSSAVLSVDTTLSEVAEAALDNGASLINDISAGMEDPAMLPLAARRAVTIILMHMQGQPATMQVQPRYKDVVSEVRDFLQLRLTTALAAGITPENIWLDPGIGFGKTLEHNLKLLRHLPALAELGRPLLLGVSRKKFIGQLTDQPQAEQRVWGTAAAIAWCVANRAEVLRVHDVKPMVQVVHLVHAIQTVI